MPESVDATGLVVAAYGAILVLLCGFVIYVARGQAAISREIEELGKKLEKASRQ